MCGNAVGLFAKYPVLGFLFGNHIVVKRTEHRGCCRGFCFLLFAEDAQEPLAFSLAGAFICALTDYERHFIGYTPIECPLTGMYIRQLLICTSLLANMSRMLSIPTRSELNTSQKTHSVLSITILC